jgi:hypothetical protein
MRTRRTVAECTDCGDTLVLDGDMFVHEVSENVECRRCTDCDEPLHLEPNGDGTNSFVHDNGQQWCVEDDGTPIPTLDPVEASRWAAVMGRVS